MSKSILLIHRRSETLAPGLRKGLRNADLVGQLSVVTEPGHVERHDPGVDVRLVADAGDPDRVRSAAMDILRVRPIDHVLAPFEMTMVAAGYLRSYFGLPGTGFDTSIAFTNKYVMKRILAAAGVPVARCDIAYATAQLPEVAAGVGYPVVVKPVLGWGSREVHVCAGEADLDRQYPPSAELNVPVIVEEQLDVRREYHVDGIVHDGEVVFVSPSAYFTPMLRSWDNLGSYCLPAEDPDRGELETIHRDAIRALGLRAGITHLEAFRTPDGLRVGEVASRPSGGGVPEAIGLQHGVDVWDAFLKTSLGLPPDVRALTRPGIVAHYYLPLRPGRIARITPAEELRAVPSVLGVDLHSAVGDEVPDQLTLTDAAGVVYFGVDDRSEIPLRMKEIVDQYELETACTARFAPDFSDWGD